MDSLYSGRNGSALKSYLLKRVMNGVVGKLLESRKDNDGNIIEYGSLYNPIYHALCTTRTRLRVFEFIVQNNITQDELVFIGVDGVKSTHYVSLPFRSSMGKWRCSGNEPAIVLSPGAVITNNRNFKRTGYAELWSECMAHPGSYKLGIGGDIDLHKLWLNQNRVFGSLPGTARELLGKIYQSDTTEL
jgi:hypothetical protein